MFVGISNENVNCEKRSVFVHNEIHVGDDVELIFSRENVCARIVGIDDGDGKEIAEAHGGQQKHFRVTFSKKIEGLFLMRKRVVAK